MESVDSPAMCIARVMDGYIPLSGRSYVRSITEAEISEEEKEKNLDCYSQVCRAVV